MTLDGSQRHVNLTGEDLESLRLGYAQHVYRQQGATVERSVVVTGGWQTSKESAYVQASRARQGTEWFLARDELGLEGQDDRRVRKLADKMRNSRAQTPSLAHPELPTPDWGRGFKPRSPRAAAAFRDSRAPSTASSNPTDHQTAADEAAPSSRVPNQAAVVHHRSPP